MKSESVRVGIVGMGNASNSHLQGYISHPQAEVIAVCDLDAVRAVQIASQHRIGKIFTSFSEMLESAPINSVDIATPTFLHASMTRQACAAGMHVHCEKPFCRSVMEGTEACEAAHRSGVKLVVGETYVFITSHMKARELVEAGEIGRPLQVRQRHGAWLKRKTLAEHLDSEERHWRADGEKSGGGDYPWIFDHAVHFFAAAEYLMLDRKISEVHSVTGTCRVDAKHRQGPYSNLEDDIPIITWKYDDSDCQGVWMRAERLNGKYDYMSGFSTTIIGETGMIEVLGEGGRNLIWDGQQQHLVLHRDGRETRCFRFDEGGDDVWNSEICYYSRGHINQVHHFVDCVVQDREPRFTGEDGVHSVRCTLATIRSAREGRPIRVDEIGPEYTAY
ncbi:MAG: Gfo/Idh/MocA family oxidoreductase [Candidatus Poribacteria bacterium]|nr:Gfo/Idh/MocA family oxidoreductase [Candidatus Poribacteria bacterium]